MCLCVCSRQICDKEAANSGYLEERRQAVVEVQSLQDSVGGSMDVVAMYVFHLAPAPVQ